MCGICGKLNFDSESRVSPSLIKAMMDTIRHRGPDDEGIYTSGPLGLGHRRLSIIGLSTGHQPLSNEDGTVWVTFNGEIYNYKDLKRNLVAKGHVFSTDTDTEVIVHLYEEYGEACIEKLRGMFAFAVWDDRQKVLLLARDRVGIKPVYYWLTDDCLIFASEIKALLADPDVAVVVSPEMIDRFLCFLYLPGEETLFKNIRKLLPGTYLVVKNGRSSFHQYWDLQFNTCHMTLPEAEDQLLAELDDAVRLHMISDVPVGFLLSGGVDSTAMLGLAVGTTDHPLSSYTLGFSEQGVIDERPYARLAARQYGSDHHEMTISAQQFVDFVPEYVRHMEEPVCEPHAIALYYVARLAKDYVKVLISGEGGDEAFAGYPGHRNILWLERLKSVLGPLRGVASTSLRLLSSAFRSPRIGRYVPLLTAPFESYYYSRTSNPYSFFNRSHTLYTGDFANGLNRDGSAELVHAYWSAGPESSVLNKMLYLDTKTALVDDLLLKADKMTMANSLELRVPLLDHKLLEFAASLPEKYKVCGFTTKYVVKRALRALVPEQILDRKKVGFPVPYPLWLKTDLRGWLSDILLSRRSVERGYFNPSRVEQMISDNGRSGGYSKEVFSLASLELLLQVFVDGRCAPVVEDWVSPAPSELAAVGTGE